MMRKVSNKFVFKQMQLYSQEVIINLFNQRDYEDSPSCLVLLIE